MKKLTILILCFSAAISASAFTRVVMGELVTSVF